jgi:hypothetical protein
MGKNHSGDSSGAKPVDARVARRRQDALGRRLRQMYDDVVSEDVPDDFLSFLERADGRDSQKKSPDGDADGADPKAPPLRGRPMKTEP